MPPRRLLAARKSAKVPLRGQRQTAAISNAHPTMKMVAKAVVLMLALGAAVLAFGFVLFAVSVTREDATG